MAIREWEHIAHWPHDYGDAVGEAVRCGLEARTGGDKCVDLIRYRDVPPSAWAYSARKQFATYTLMYNKHAHEYQITQRFTGKTLAVGDTPQQAVRCLVAALRVRGEM